MNGGYPSVEAFIDERLSPDMRKPANLALAWLRRTPDVMRTIEEVYGEGATGNTDAFREFAAQTWSEIDTEYGGVLESWDIAADDESWVGVLALVVGAWGFVEMGRR